MKTKDTEAFSYHEGGFTISYKETFIKVNWTDITRIDVYKADLITLDEVRMEIFYDDNKLTITEELAGWHLFVEKLKDVFSSIPKDWDLAIIQPPFAANYRTIYEW